MCNISRCQVLENETCKYFTWVKVLGYFPVKWSCGEIKICLPVPSLNFMSRLLVVSHWRPKGMLHPTATDNQMPVCQCKAPSDTNRVNITQLQTMSNTFLSCGLSPTQTPPPSSLTDSVETDSVCAQISHLSPSALRPWPKCVRHERPAEVGQTWQEALICSHFEIKREERRWH